MRAGPADGARGLQAFLAAGLVWRGDDAGHEIVRQALPPPPGVLPRLIDTWKRIAYLRPGLTADGRQKKPLPDAGAGRTYRRLSSLRERCLVGRCCRLDVPGPEPAGLRREAQSVDAMEIRAISTY